MLTVFRILSTDRRNRALLQTKKRRPGLRTLKKWSMPIKYIKEADNSRHEKSESRKRGRKGRPPINKHTQKIKDNENDHSYERKQRRYIQKSATEKTNATMSLRQCVEDNENRKCEIKSKVAKLQQHKEVVNQSLTCGSKIQEKIHTESTLIKGRDRLQYVSTKKEKQITLPQNVSLHQILALNEIQPTNNIATQRTTELPENNIFQQGDFNNIKENETNEKSNETSDTVLMEELKITPLDSAQFLNDFILPPESSNRYKPHSYFYDSNNQDISAEFKELRDAYFRSHHPFKNTYRFNFCICPRF
ncbi:uncharacterized protein LOC118198409 isoform X2 [Stegodyphus dumicola]|uniref:uncharacterized protein LOC118198409 isoform X2 n=1 Tax=Stegodyphus dumicola TaxID=202533 RepID=UPI0015A922A9|nr:uncharacterized protein LOC118198409 isoform X2 [Stegodyphus dumicola]